MLFWSRVLLAVFLFASVSCSGSKGAVTPTETFKTYVKAMKQKDTTTMKVLLSDETLKMHEQEAQAQGLTVDDIITRDSLITEGQKSVEYRNEKVEGEKATLEVKNAYGSWETLPFVLEGGNWKIDKQSFADQFIKDVEQGNQIFEDQNLGHSDDPSKDGVQPGSSTDY